MRTRRSFIQEATALAMTTAVASPLCVPGEPASVTGGRGAPIKSAIRREETILRLGGDGGVGPMTWTADDRQLVASLDGAGWPVGPPREYLVSQLAEVIGEPNGARIENTHGYPAPRLWDALYSGQGAFYYSCGMLAVGSYIYQTLWAVGFDYTSTDESPWSGTKKSRPVTDFRPVSTKLIYSPDNGRSWRNHDGSAPVTWERRGSRSRKTMLFHEEAQEAFSAVGFVQMGKGYEDNRDGYVYAYGPNGNSAERRNSFAMLRVPKTQVADRGAYEYFAGARPDGTPKWAKDIANRVSVVQFPQHSAGVQLRWSLPDIAFNASLGLYLLVASGAPGHEAFTEESDSKPSLLQLWQAANPWGPWQPFYEEPAWTPAGDPGARASLPLIAPKWIAADGKSFWLVWTDFQNTRGFGQTFSHKDLYRARDPDDLVRVRRTWHQYHPYFNFNAQRVDLVTA